MRRLIQFTIRDLFWICIVAAISLGWFFDSISDHGRSGIPLLQSVKKKSLPEAPIQGPSQVQPETRAEPDP